jgi:hypothetical protein
MFLKDAGGNRVALVDSLSSLVQAVYSSPQADDPITYTLQIANPVAQLVALANIKYAVGDFAKVKDYFKQLASQPAAQLLMADSAILAAISTGDFVLYRKIIAWLNELIAADYPPTIRTLAEVQAATGYAGALKPSLIAASVAKGEFGPLPPQLRILAIHRHTETLLSMRDYPMMLATAQTAVSLIDSIAGQLV